jgi:hypothetical protein
MATTSIPVLGTVLRHPHFESFAVEWNGTQGELKKLARELLGPEWAVRRLTRDRDWEIVNPAHLKGGWEPVRAVALADPEDTPSSELPAAEAWEVARRIRKHPKATSAEPLFAVYTPPPDESPAPGAAASSVGGGAAIAGALADCEWALKKSGVIAAWSVTTKPGEGVRIGHPDTGYQIHNELDAGRLVLTLDRDLIEDDDDALDPLIDGILKNPGHGTATGSVIVSGRGSVPPFVSGVAPRAELVPIRTSPTVVLLSMRNLIRAIEYAIAQKLHVLSISMGGLGSFTLQKVVQRAVAEGVIVVAAAGNRVKFVVHPGAYPEVVCMAASNFDDRPWSGSCRGPAVTVSAPGESVWRARVFHEKGKMRTTVEPSSGTSYAVSVVAGVAAMWLSHHGRQKLIAKLGGKHLLAPTFKNILIATARIPAAGWDRTKFGAGIVDAKAVLEADPGQFVPASAAPKATTTPAAEVRRRLGTIAGLPRKEDTAIASAMADLTGAPTARVSTSRMADLGPELAFLAATDPAVQEALEATADSGGGGVAAAAFPSGSGPADALRDALAKGRHRVSATAAEALQLPGDS